MSTLSTPYSPHTPREIQTADGPRAVPERMTTAEFREFPWPEDQRWELVKGAPVMSPSPRGGHQNLLAKLVALCDRRRPDLIVFAEYDVELPLPGSYFRPDITLVADDERYDPETVPYTGVPELVIEILSPSTRSIDVGPKFEALERAGVPEYWIVEPSTGDVTVNVLRAGSYVVQVPDGDHFTQSPTLETRVRIRVEGRTFALEERNSGGSAT